jgi:hypothetical protein
MRTPKTIPAGFISSVPQSDDIESVRPDDGKIWTTTKASKPEIIIALVSAGEEGVLLGRLLVKGDMPGVTVFVKTSENDDFKPVSTKEDQQPKVRGAGQNLAYVQLYICTWLGPLLSLAYSWLDQVATQDMA